MTDDTTPVCAWTHHATARLGERFGSKSNKIKVRIEELLAMGDYTEIEDTAPAADKLAVRLSVRDNAIGLVLKLDRKRVVVVTVLPAFSKRIAHRKWARQ